MVDAIKEFDTSMLNIVVVPSSDSMNSPNYHEFNYNFSWDISKIDYEKKRIHIKLNFTTPLQISPEIVQDQLIVRIDSSNFTERQLLSTRIKKQVPDNKLTRTV